MGGADARPGKRPRPASPKMLLLLLLVQLHNVTAILFYGLLIPTSYIFGITVFPAQEFKNVQPM